MKRLLSLALPLMLFVVPTAFANVVPFGPVPFSGTGLGSVNTILTVGTNTTQESGCVAWNGTADVVGPTACPPGVTGGDEKTGESQTQTRTIAELGLTSAADLRIVLNLSENEFDPAILQNLVLRIFSPAGAEVFNSGAAFVPVIDLFGQGGTGQAGYVFVLDATQAAAAQPHFTNPNNRIGLAATISDVTAGDETFFVADVGAIGTPLATADLGITKTAPATVIAGNQITYSLTATNAGPDAATNVTVTDVLPTTANFVSLAAAAGWTCTAPPAGTSGGTVTCTIPTLAAGATAGFTIVLGTCADVACGTAANNRATINAETFDPAVANNTATTATTIQAQSDLAITKTGAPATVTAGGTITFTLNVTNAGPSSSVNTVVTDTLPAGFTAASVTTTTGTCSGQGTGTVTCNLGTLGAAGQCGAAPTSAQVTITAAVPATGGGSATNTATVTSGNCLADAATTNNTATFAFTVNPAPAVAAAIPTLSEWMLILMALLLVSVGVFVVKQ